MRIISFLRFIIHFLLFFSDINCLRIRKASRNALNQVKALIDHQVEREIAASPAGIQADAVLIKRKNNDSLPQHNELSVNNPEDYYQGDIDLSEEQVELIKNNLQTEKTSKKIFNNKFVHRTKRKVGRAPFYKLWDITKPISYDFDQSIRHQIRQKIRESIAVWERNTCVRFRENGQNIDRIEFFDGGGCSSFVGKAGGTQGISIGTGCDFIGIITHEIGHALGIFHEQARPDQKDHIFINYNNIAVNRWNNFQAVSGDQTELYGLPYDTGSVMHYGAYGFANDPYVPTITTKDRYQQQTIGQREGPSFLDFQAINLAYKCLDRCPRRYCKHGGYVNPNDCLRCTCPNGLAGYDCAEVQPSSCGRFIEVSTEIIYISSPYYPEYSPPNEKCIWLLEAPPGGQVFLQFTDYFQLECQDTCDRSFIEIKLAADFRITGYRFCCSIKPQHIFESVTNQMIVIYKSSFSHRGFKARIWSNHRHSLKSTITVPATSTTLITSSESLLQTTELTTETTGSESFTTEIENSVTEESYLVSKTIALNRTNIITSTVANIETSLEKPLSTANPFKQTHHSTTTNVHISTTDKSVFAKKQILPFVLTKSTVSTSKTTTLPIAISIIPETYTPKKSWLWTTIPPTLLSTTSSVIQACECGEWSAWVSTCSQQCGGCGKRSRIRHCASSDCRTEDKRTCNYNACPSGTNFLINNGEFHILWKGCCVGLFRSKDECAPLESNQNPFLTFLASLFTSQNPKQQTKGKYIRHRLED